jgi:hypothetical protein
MTAKLTIMLAFASLAARAGKPPECLKSPMVVYVATGPAYGITGDGAATELIGGAAYTRYADGEGGVLAYVDSCSGSLTFNFNGARKLNLSFAQHLNDGTDGPVPLTSGVAGNTVIRGFSWPPGGNLYTSIYDANFKLSNGYPAGIRYEPVDTEWGTATGFPQYPGMNVPCSTSAVTVSVQTADIGMETGVQVKVVAPQPVSCHDFSGAVATLLEGTKVSGAQQLNNVGQYAMDFKYIVRTKP